MQSNGMIIHMHELALVRSFMISSYQLGNETTTTYPSVGLHQIVELVQKVLVFGLEHRGNFLHHLLSGPLTRCEHSEGLQKRFVLHMLLLRLLLLQIIIIRHILPRQRLLLLVIIIPHMLQRRLLRLLITFCIRELLVEAVFDSEQKISVLTGHLAIDHHRHVAG